MTVTIKDGWLHGSLPDDTGREWPIRRFPQRAARGRLSVVPPNLCLHTTESDGYIKQLRFPSQWQCGDGIIGQHIALGFAGDAVNMHDGLLSQIEMVGRSRLSRWLPAEPTLGPTVALVAWLHKTGRIRTGLKRPPRFEGLPVVLDRGPQAVTTYYRRMVPNVDGVYGHVDIANNSHWDPGSFDYPVFFDRVRRAIAGGSDDYMTDAERKQLETALELARDARARANGMEDRIAGRPRPADKGERQRGWDMADALLVTGPPGAHTHEAKVTLS